MVETVQPPAPRWQPLTGGTVVWVFMTVEIVTFGLFLLGFAAGWRGQEEVFAGAQALLHRDSGIRGTALLLLGSGLAYAAVVQNAGGHARNTALLLGGAALTGVAFAVNKIAEYASPSLSNVNLSTNGFWCAYLFLTGLHLLHVLGGVGFLGYLAVQSRAGAYGPGNALTIEAGAAYWHLVDLVWLLVFPILYLMHP